MTAFSSLGGGHAITPSHDVDNTINGAVEIFSLRKGAIFIRGEDGNLYFCPAVKFPHVPGSTFRGTAVGDSVRFVPKVDNDGRHVVDLDYPIEAHLSAEYAVRSDTSTLPVSNGAPGLICYTPNTWMGVDKAGNVADPCVSCDDFAAFRTSGPFEKVLVSDGTEGDIIARVLVGDNKEIVQPEFLGEGEFIVNVGADILFVFPNGRVLIQTIARRSSWEGEGKYPNQNKNNPGWHHHLVVGLRRFEQVLDLGLLTSGNVDAIRRELPTSGLAVDNDRYAEAIAEAGLALK